MPLTVTGSWPDNNQWGTQPKNAVDQNPTVNWTVESIGYVQLQYLQLKSVDATPNGKRSWIEIPYVPKQNTIVEVCMENTSEVFATSGACAQSVFYSGTPGNGSGMTMEITSGVDNHHFNCVTSKNSYRDPRGQAESNKITYLLSVAGIQQRNDDGKFTMLSPFSDEEISVCSDPKKANLCFFSHPAVDANTHMSYAGRVYSAKIYEGDELKFDLVPVKDGTGTDARCGFYDMKSKKFYPFFEMVDYVENTTDDRLHVKLPLAPEPDSSYKWGNSIVRNGHFQSASDWTSFPVSAGDDTRRSISDEDGTKAFKFVCPAKQSGEQAYTHQMFIEFTEPLKAGDVYYVSFYYKAEKAVNIGVQAHSKHGDYNDNGQIGSIDFATEWKLYEKKFTVSAGEASNSSGVARPYQCIAFNLNVLDEENTYYMTNVVVRKQKYESTRNVPAAASGYQWTDNLVRNGGLDTDDLTSFIGNERCTSSVEEDVLKVKSTAKPNQEYDWYSQMFFSFKDPIMPGESYYISFDYRADKDATSAVQAHSAPGAYNAGLGSITFRDYWQTYTTTATVNDAQGKNGGFGVLALNLNELADENNYYFDNIVIKKQVLDSEASKRWSSNLVSGYDVTNNGTTIDGLKVVCPQSSGNYAWDSQFFINLSEPLLPNEKYYVSVTYSANQQYNSSGNQISLDSYLLPEKDKGIYPAGVSGAMPALQPQGLNSDDSDKWLTVATVRTVNSEILSQNSNQPMRIGFNIWVGQNVTYKFRDIVVRKQIDDTSVPVTEPSLSATDKKWSKSLVKNGYFSTDNTASFSGHGNYGETVTGAIVDNPTGTGRCFKVTSVKVHYDNGNPLPQTSQLQIILDEPIQTGERFYISFDYMASVETTTPTEAHTKTNYNYWHLLDPSPAFTKNWQSKTWTQTVTADQGANGGMQMIVFNLNSYPTPADFYIKNVVVKKEVPIEVEENNNATTQLSIEFKNLYNENNEWTSNRHLFSLGSHEDGTMALNTLQGRYRFVSGKNVNVTNLNSENSTNPLDSRARQHTAVFTTDKCTIDGTDYNASGDQTWIEPDALYLMGTHCDPNPVHSDRLNPLSFRGQVFRATLKENGITRYDLQPARDVDGKYGFYDFVTRSMFYPDGCATNPLTGDDPQLAKSLPASGMFSLETKTPSAIVPKRFMITTVTHDGGMQNNTANNPKNWRLMASNDGDTWTQLELGIIRPKYSAPATDVNTVQYLYNVGTGTFLKGGVYGTRGSVGAIGQSDEGTAQQFKVKSSSIQTLIATYGNSANVEKNEGQTYKDRNNCIQIVCPEKDDGQAWDQQFFLQLPRQLKAGEFYDISFEYAASNLPKDKDNVQISTQLHSNGGGAYITNYSNLTFKKDWQTAYFRGIVTSAQANTKTIAFCLNVMKGVANNYYFRNVVVKVKSSDDELIDYVSGDWKNTFVIDKGIVWLDRDLSASEEDYRKNYNNWSIIPDQGATNICEIANAGFNGAKLGLYSDVVNGISDAQVYVGGNSLYTKWAFVNEADYATYQTALSSKSYSDPSTIGTLPNATTHWFTILNNTEQYSMYRLDVDEIGWGQTMTLSDIAITADYGFAHYVGAVYDSQSGMGTPPKDLTKYKTTYKTSQDDYRITNSDVTLQRAHEYEHVIYAMPGQTVDLTPFVDFYTSDRYEERYTRWYDYRTDTYSNRITFDPVNGSNVLTLNKGHFAGSVLAGERRRGTRALYTAPNRGTSFLLADGNEIMDIIAIEAAHGFTGDELGWVANQYQLKEPTLHWRHKFVIMDARYRTKEMTDNNADYINKHKITLMCPAGTPFQYPLPAYEYATNNQKHDNTTGFYNANNQSVYHYKIETWKDNTSNPSNLLGSTQLTHTYNTPDKKGEITYSTSISDATIQDRLAYSFKEIDGFNRVFYIKNPQTKVNSEGEEVTQRYVIRIYAMNPYNGLLKIGGSGADKDKDFLLSEYDLDVMPAKDAAMVDESTLKTDAYVHQTPNKLKEKYGKPTTVVNFDKISTSDCIEKDGSYYSKWPWLWEDSSYGFAYDDSWNVDYNNYMVVNNSNYLRYKSYNDVKDRNQIENNKQGFFFYANAASDPSRMAVLNIGKNFCENTTVYVSAWICELQGQNDYAETANVIFSFRGVDDKGNETVLNSFVTGYVPGGWNTPYGYDKEGFVAAHTAASEKESPKNPDQRGHWMHVYYTFQPIVPEGTDFHHYIITLENNATSSFGADYAIDDIRAYVSKAELKARQSVPLCNGATQTSLELFGDFDELLMKYALSEATEGNGESKDFYYCILDQEKYEATLKEEYGKISNPSEEFDDWKESPTTDAYKKAFNDALLTKTYGGFNDNYGKVTLYTEYSKNKTYSPSSGTRHVLFDCSASDENMKLGKTYIIAMIPAGQYADEDGDGNNDSYIGPMAFNLCQVCNSVSEFDVTTSFGLIKIDGHLFSDQEGMSFCANQRPVVTINLNGIKQGGEVVEKKSAVFDWYFGPLGTTPGHTAYNGEKKDGLYLMDAMKKFREVYPAASQTQVMNGTVVPTGEFKESMLDYIKEMVTAEKIVLYKGAEAISTTDLYNIQQQNKFYITALPINPTPYDNSILYCLEPLQVSVDLDTNTPSMKDGADQGITYPADMTDVPLRIGLKQLQRTVIDDLDHTFDTNDRLLWLPLREVAGSKSTVNLLVKRVASRTVDDVEPAKIHTAMDDFVYLAASNDPAVLAGTSGAVDITTSNPEDPRWPIISDLKVIGRVKDISASVTETGNVCQIAFLRNFKFREGYWYTLKFHYADEGNPKEACPGDLVFTIKVVPEYQMWTGAVSRNWNDDRNWRRVTSTDLLGTAAATAEYVTDGKVEGESVNTNTASFVPADFTKVVIPGIKEAVNVPMLYNLRGKSLVESGTENVASIDFAGYGSSSFIKNVATSSSIGPATYRINFDMSSVDKSEGGDVACRSWYDHTCQYIHFNSEAQMLSQQYLHYEKAWADFEMEPNKWTTVASPLINVVAGDFYLPTDGARQNTPLFEPIMFNTTLHDRFAPAVFQRSWNVANAKVVHLDGDETNSAVSLEWSHVYNDVNVNYSAGIGFSIKPDVSMLPEAKRPSKVKFRLPKEDTNYDYWNPDHEATEHRNENVHEDGSIGSVNERTHKLTDFNSSSALEYKHELAQNGSSATKYFLVGNPMMCHLDMQEFFNKNTTLEKKYWVLTGDGQRYAEFTENTPGYVGTGTGYVAPFQSFFVALNTADNQSKLQPVFTNDMMAIVKLSVDATANNQVMKESFAVDRQNDPNVNPYIEEQFDREDKPNGYNPDSSTPSGNGAKAYTMTLSVRDKDGIESTVMIMDGLRHGTCGVEALFDQNLRDHPMLYANVAGEAMSLCQIMPGDTIPIGLTGARDEVKLSIEGVKDFDFDLFLIDSEEGTVTPLEGDVVLKQDASGVRYYIATRSANDTEMEGDVNVPRVVSKDGYITVYAPATCEIETSAIYNTGGIRMDFAEHILDSHSVKLYPGVYIVNLLADGRTYSYKLLVR